LIQERTGVASVGVAWEGKYQVPGDAEIVVNATSIGLHPHGDDLVPLDLNSLETGMIVCDVIPNPPETRLLHEAATRGCTIMNGLGMLVNQGIIGIRLWSGLEANPSVMRQALEAVLF
jgi:shikimate dehydrogenase